MYAVTPNELETKLLVSKVESALKGGVKFIQYRNKAAGKSLLLRQATALLAACRAYGASLIINDHLDLCAQIDADGLHIGAADCKPAPVRRLLGADKIIGVTCYNKLLLAHEAEANGANYVTFGTCLPLDKTLTIFEEAKGSLGIPVVGFGDINIENAAKVKAAGADAIAVIDSLFDAKNITNLSQQYNALYN